MYDYSCANGCLFDNPERIDTDEDVTYEVCPICGSEEFTPNFKVNNSEG